MSLEGLPRPTTLRDGSTVVIHALSPADGAKLQAFYRSLPEEERLFLREDVTTSEWLQRFVHQSERGELISLLAEHDGVVVGEATLYRPLAGWSRHVGEIRLSVAMDMRHKGLGAVLAHELVRVAITLGVEKLVAHYVEKQAPARQLFERLGFRQEAVLRGHVKDMGGVKRDLIVASNDVSHIWDSMEALLADFSPTHG